MVFVNPLSSLLAQAGSPKGFPAPMLNHLTHSDFAQCLGSQFQLEISATQIVDVELVEATLLGAPPAAEGKAQRQGFSLVFRVPREMVNEQRTYRMQHRRIGVMDLFLVPIGPDQKGMLCEAIFN